MSSVRPPSSRPWYAVSRTRHRVSLVVAGCVAGLSMLASTVALAQQQLSVTRESSVVRFSSDAASAERAALPAVLRKPLTLRLQRVSVETALKEVMARGDITIAYSRAVVPLDRKVSVDVREQPTIEALRQILAGDDVELWISADGRMALVPSERPARPARSEDAMQGGIITGTVTSTDNHAPLLGVSVTVSGTALGMVTGADGRFTVRGVPAGSHYVHARRIGFASDSVLVNVVDNQTVTADLSLRVLAVQLGEVVAIGYGTASRRDLTGAVSSVSSEQISRAPTPSVDQALLGHAPGVQVMSASGQPGAGAMVRIRGGNSISASNEPLYVVDGVPITASAKGANTTTLEATGTSGLSPLAAVNPGDIESIEILKDASASAIYGARAANGVVLITTKRGHSGERAVNLSAYFGQAQVRRDLPLLNATQFATMVNQAYTNAGQPALYTPAQISSMGAGTDWQKQIFRTAPTAQYDLSFAGGDKNTTYYISGNLLRTQGVVIGTDVNRGSFRLNLDQTMSDKFRVGNSLTVSREQGRLMPNGGAGQEVSSVLLNAILAPPTVPVRGADGEYFTGTNPLTGRPFPNPVAAALLITNQEEQNRVIGNLFAEYDLSSRLTFRSTLGGDYLTSVQDFYSPSTTLPGMNYNGYGSRGSLATTNWLNENTLHYTNHYGHQNSFDVLGGITVQRTNATNVSGTAEGFLTDRLGPNALNTAKTFVGVWTGAPHSSLLSYFSRANWGIADRYLFTVTGRVDGSSKFGQGNQYGFFPSAAFAWRASDESFMKRLGWFDDLKFRVSEGRTGNQDIGNYASLATLQSTLYVFGTSRAVGYAPSTLANPNLKWETTNQFDAGVDAAVLHSRLTFTADYYRKKTNDLLLYVPVPGTSGFNTSLQNVGSVSNRGFELGVNTVNLNGVLGWTTALNLAWNRNKVLGLGPSTQIIAPTGVGAGANQNPTILQVGAPINSFYGWIYSGMQNGVPTYKDLNGDGKITDADRAIIGNAQPNYTGGMTNQLTLGDFGLSVFLQWSVGNKIYDINRALLTSAAGNVNQLADVMQAGTNGVPTPKIGNTFDSHPSTLFVEDGTYLRGKNIRLDYNIPGQWLAAGRLARLTKLQLFVSAQNFFTKTNYKGYDPEITEYAATNLAQGFDFGTYPQPRQVTIGFNAGF